MAVSPPWFGEPEPRRGRWLERPRLLQVLREADARAVVLCAPAGYGKSVLATQWLAERRTSWCVASPAGSDFRAFAVGFARAAAAIVPGAGERNGPDDTPGELAQLLADELAEWPVDAWLAVEDYHLVADSPEAEEFVDRLLALAPVQLLVATRRRPRWATARRLLYGEVIELGREELALTDAEATAVAGRHATEVASLLHRAEGWPAVVALGVRAAARGLPEARVMEMLFGYVGDEILHREPLAVQELMLDLAVAPRVDSHTVREIAAAADVKEPLDRLRQDGLLHPGTDGALHFHPLVREYLVHTLRLREPPRYSRLVGRAVAAARGRGALEEAFALAVETERLETAAEILADAVGELLAAGRVDTVERWLAAVGDAGDADPRLRLARVEVLVRRGELFAAAALAERVAAELPAGDGRLSVAWRLAGRALHLLSEDRRGLELYLRAVDTATTSGDLVTALRSAVALAAQLDDPRLEELVDRLAVVAGDDLGARLQLLPARVFLASRRDSLAPLWQLAEPLLERVSDAPDPATKTTFLRAAAYLAIARSDYARAQDLAERALTVCETFRLGRIKRAFCLCSRASADIGRRQLARAESTLRDLASLPIEHTHVLVGERRNLRAKLLLARGEPDELLVVADEDDGAQGGEHRALFALAAAAAGDLVRARAAAEEAEQASTLIETRYYVAFARLIARMRDEGAAVRDDALALLERTAGAEMLDAFVVAYRAYPPLLHLLADDAAIAPLLQGVLARANDHALGRRAGVGVSATAATAAAVAGLTPRENEVLALIVEGLGNRAIAKRLFISEKTTKVHIGHIFDKLGVESRVQAVLAAQELVTRS